MKNTPVKSYRIPVMRKNITKNPFRYNIYDSIWECISCGKLSDTSDGKESYNDSVRELIESAYKKIMSGKIKFDNVPDFDKSNINKDIDNIFNTTYARLDYIDRSSGSKICLIEIRYVSLNIYGTGIKKWVTFGAFEEWQLLRYNDKYFLIEPNEDEDFTSTQNRIIADFDASISIKKIIMQAAKLIAPKVYN